MTLGQMIAKIAEKDTYDLYMWVNFLANKINCKDCMEVCGYKNTIPNCSACIPTKSLINKLKRKKTLKEEYMEVTPPDILDDLVKRTKTKI